MYTSVAKMLNPQSSITNGSMAKTTDMSSRQKAVARRMQSSASTAQGGRKLSAI